MMAENPNWWSMQQQQKQLPSSSSFISSTVMPSQYVLRSSSPPLSNNCMDDNKELPNSWSQLLMGGLSGGCEDYRFGMSHFHQRKLENWQDDNIPNPCMRFPVVDVKQEVSYNQDRGICGQGDEEFQALRPPLAAAWSPQVLPVSSPGSCVTTSNTSSNILKFSNKADEDNNHHHHFLPDISSESNSTASGGLTKKPRVQSSSSQPLLKVRKEKLGDRITALHQLVSPFGKTDTASVLLEAIGCIRFLQGQIEALSSPYLDSAPASMRSQQSVTDNQDTPKNLRSRGLCLVPISCTLQVDNDNGAGYWAPSLGGGF